MAHPTMSMEAALDEERLAVLELMAGLKSSDPRSQRGTSGGPGGRSASPFNNPRSPVRSMLDIDEEPVARHLSIAATTAGSSMQPQVRSMLDIGGNHPSASSRSAQTSPSDGNHITRSMNNNVHPRSKSDAALRPADFGPRVKGDVTSGYQFSGYLSSNPGGPVAPKRNTLAGKKPIVPSAMGEAVRGELGGYSGRDRGQIQSSGGLGPSKSRSPSNRLGLRSNSPGVARLPIVPDSDLLSLDNGLVLDKNIAYRRLSNAALARAGGSLAELSKGRRRTTSGDGPDGARLQKDYIYEAGEDAVMESSDEEHTSDDERHRGRKKDTRPSIPVETTLGMGRAPGSRQAKSMMAAAEEERLLLAQNHQATYKVKSLLEPEITITTPGGDKLKNSKPGIHPTNSFDYGGASGVNTPVDSETEAEIGDIKSAQKLSIIMTPITSTPETKRCVRILYRGDFAKMQEEADQEQRRMRKYLVATDLSDEAAHALEWTVGTVLRDGDTLLAIYCIDEESSDKESTPDPHLPHAQVTTIAATTNKPQPAHTPGSVHVGSSPVLRGTRSAAVSPMGRERSRTEQERYRAVQDITDRVSKLLRKTRLQVRVVIEVLHCKMPKHLITEVIDFINPTLVILGSRGRSALKGVILGSFSNYLVTKSSVPVMVARKRLRKHSKYKRPEVHLANNLTRVSGKNLVNAKID